MNIPDEPGAPLEHPATTPTRERNVEGERIMLATLLEDAIQESLCAPGDIRAEARAWLRNDERFTSKYAAQALDLDHDVMLKELEKKWKALDDQRAAITARTRKHRERKNVGDG